MIDDYLLTPSSRLPDASYRVMPDDAAITDDKVREARQDFLRNDLSIWIVCPKRRNHRSWISDAFARFSLRGRVVDLATQRSSSRFNGLQPAEFSLISNQKANETTVAFSFVAGYALEWSDPGEDRSGIVVDTYSVIPFVSYDRTDIKGGSEENSDVHQITPGMQFAWSSNDRLLGFVEQAAVDLSATFDEEQDARTLGTQATFDLNPTVTSKSSSTGRKSYCFADYIVGGPLGIHCTPRAIIDLRHVLDAGRAQIWKMIGMIRYLAWEARSELGRSSRRRQHLTQVY